MKIKFVLSGCIVFLLVFVGSPAQGLEPLVPYDTFSTKLMNPDKWTGFTFGEDTGTTREVVREIQRGRLRIEYAAYGDPNFDDGQRGGGTRAHFADSPRVTAFEATVQINSFKVTGCRNNPTPSEVTVHLQGFFFNTGVPIPGNHTNDVTAVIRISRRSDSQDPPQVLRISAQVFIHQGPSLFDQEMGTVRRGQKVRLRIQWDPDNDRFIFQRDKEPEIFARYTASDAAPPGGNSKFLDVVNAAANCTTDPLPVAFMEAFFDDVFVNESAAP